MLPPFDGCQNAKRQLWEKVTLVDNGLVIAGAEGIATKPDCVSKKLAITTVSKYRYDRRIHESTTEARGMLAVFSIDLNESTNIVQQVVPHARVLCSGNFLYCLRRRNQIPVGPLANLKDVGKSLDFIRAGVR